MDTFNFYFAFLPWLVSWLWLPPSTALAYRAAAQGWGHRLLYAVLLRCVAGRALLQAPSVGAGGYPLQTPPCAGADTRRVHSACSWPSRQDAGRQRASFHPITLADFLPCGTGIVIQTLRHGELKV